MKKKNGKMLALAMVTTVLFGCGQKNTEVNVSIENTPIPEATMAPSIECAEETEPPLAVEEIVPGKYDYGDYYIREGYLPIELNRRMADVTGDGVLDYLVTVMFFLPEEWEVDIPLEEKIAEQIWIANASLEIYDGAKATDEALGEAIWKGYYAAPHVGNGQISLIQEEDGDYLLRSDLYMGMGEVSYQYKVFSLSADGEEQIKDEWNFSMRIDGDTPVPYDEQVENLKVFTEKITPWVEKGEIIIATDVHLEEQFVTTENNQYKSADYYDKALTKYIPE